MRERLRIADTSVDESGQNWMMYCHEWVQIGDGAMLAVRMSDDWSRRTGEPIHLFNSSALQDGVEQRMISTPVEALTDNVIGDMQ